MKLAVLIFLIAILTLAPAVITLAFADGNSADDARSGKSADNAGDHNSAKKADDNNNNNNGNDNGDKDTAPDSADLSDTDKERIAHKKLIDEVCAGRPGDIEPQVQQQKGIGNTEHCPTTTTSQCKEVAKFDPSIISNNNNNSNGQQQHIWDSIPINATNSTGITNSTTNATGLASVIGF
jgi:hypothetical protein